MFQDATHPSMGYLEVIKEILERRGYKTQLKQDHICLIGGDPFATGKIRSAKTSLKNNDQHCYVLLSFADIGLNIKLHDGDLVAY